MILTFSQERKGVTATFRKESSGRCDQMVVRPNAKAAKTLTPQCDLSPIWNLCDKLRGFGQVDETENETIKTLAAQKRYEIS